MNPDYIFFFFREGSRVVLIPFPAIKDVNPLTQQIGYEAELRNSSKRASCSIGIVISIAQKLSGDSNAIPNVIEQVENIMGRNMHHRILRNYSMLMLFALKVIHFSSIYYYCLYLSVIPEKMTIRPWKTCANFPWYHFSMNWVMTDLCHQS